MSHFQAVLGSRIFPAFVEMRFKINIFEYLTLRPLRQLSERARPSESNTASHPYIN